MWAIRATLFNKPMYLKEGLIIRDAQILCSNYINSEIVRTATITPDVWTPHQRHILLFGSYLEAAVYLKSVRPALNWWVQDRLERKTIIELEEI